MNTAQQIHQALGIAIADSVERQRSNPSYTKKGSGRRHNSKPAIQTLKQENAGAYGRGLRNWIRRQQAVAYQIKLTHRMNREATA